MAFIFIIWFFRILSSAITRFYRSDGLLMCSTSFITVMQTGHRRQYLVTNNCNLKLIANIFALQTLTGACFAFYNYFSTIFALCISREKTLRIVIPKTTQWNNAVIVRRQLFWQLNYVMVEKKESFEVSANAFVNNRVFWMIDLTMSSK